MAEIRATGRHSARFGAQTTGEKTNGSHADDPAGLYPKQADGEDGYRLCFGDACVLRACD